MTAPVIEADGRELMRLAGWAVTEYLRAHPHMCHWEEDLLADATLGVVSAAGRFSADGGASLSTFVLRRARGAILDGLRDRSPVSRGDYARGVTVDDLPSYQLPPTSLQALADLGQDVPAIDDPAADVVDRLAFTQLLSRCPFLERKTLHALFVDQLSLTELARRLGTSVPYVSQVRDRALLRLRLNLQESPMSVPDLNTARPREVHDEIASRLKRKAPEAVVAVGERTGWWTPDDVDWVLQAGVGPRPAGWTLDTGAPRAAHLADPPPAQPTTAAADEHPLDSNGWCWSSSRKEWMEPNAWAEHMRELARQAAQPVTVDVGEVVVPAGSAWVTALPAGELFVDRSYQRPLDELRAQRMAKAWDPRMVGTLDVSDRGEHADAGRYAIVNGQHRHAAAIIARGTDVHLAVTVHEGLDVAGEARLMHELDRTTKKLSGHEKWRARRGSGDPLVLQVEEIAARHGLRVDAALADGVLRSYGAAEKLLQTGGGQLLDSTLGVLSAAYGTAAAGYIAPLISAVGQLLHTHEMDLDRLARALAGVRPEQLRATATQLRDIEPGTLAELMARAVAGVYNRTTGTGGRIAGGRA